MRRFLLLFSLTLLFILSACAASGKETAAAGSEGIPVPSQWSDAYTGIFLDFTGDGSLHYIQNGSEMWLPCKILADRFIVSYDSSNQEEIAYAIEGNTMTVTWADGAKTALTRQGGGAQTPSGQNSEQKQHSPVKYVFREENAVETVFAENINRGGRPFQMVADKHGTVHALFTNAAGDLMHCWREGEAWSGPEQVLPATIMDQGFERPAFTSFLATLTPQGEPCVVFDRAGSVLFIAEKKNGSWETAVIKEPEEFGTSISYDFKAPFFAFDKQGNPQFLYKVDFNSYYLNNTQLTKAVSMEYTDPDKGAFTQGLNQGILPGLGSDLYDPVFTVAPDGVWHLDYLSFTHLHTDADGISKNQYKYCYSTSSDNGRTWQVPVTVCENLNELPKRSVLYGKDGTKHISLYDGHNLFLKKPLLTIASISPDGSMAVQRHFDAGGENGIWGADAPYADIRNPEIEELAAEMDGTLYFYGKIYPHPSYCFALSRDGQWLITRIIRPEEHGTYFDYGMLPLNKDEIAIYSTNAMKNTFSLYSFRR